MTWQRTLTQLVEERTGIELASRQLRHDVKRKIDLRVARLGLRGPEAWVWRLAQAGPEDPEFTWLIEAVTVGYSYFFRDVEQLRVVVEVLADLARRPRSRRSLHVWCAGCSTGQEPWSLAILADRAGLPLRIVGTDLNPGFVERAREGAYPASALDQVPEDLRPGLVEISGGIAVRRDLRSRVSFRTHNLIDPGPYPYAEDGGRFDLVLCRNVFIYFSAAARQRVATRFTRSLEPTGWLFLGPGETLEDVDVPARGQMWGRRLGYTPTSFGGGPVHARTPTPIPARRGGRVGPAVSAADPLGEAERAVLAGATERAEALLIDLTRTGSPDAWLALAHLRLRTHDFEGALVAAREVLSRDGLSARAHLAAGVAHRKLGAVEAATTELRRALFLAPDLWQAAFLLAGVFARQGRPTERLRALRRARQAIERTAGQERAPVPSFGVEGIAGGPERAREALRRLTRDADPPAGLP